ncbi:DoxX family membrane protein [Salipaludibacillus agaradhaerens]|nr:DoxX family membrane protein [Salipaludibacillus agaradhaerens]MCR6117810.1 DoxX family membrane protein [Salipaludibacillus agaradhaerens]UJW56975.1 DoxX family membrane protein [Bacillus sp. A116_S68]
MSSVTKRLTILLISLCLLPVSEVFAHVKWFTEAEPKRAAIETIITPHFITLAFLTAIIVAVLPRIVPVMLTVPLFKHTEDFLGNFRSYTYYLIKYGAALAVFIQVITGGLFAPELLAPSDVWAVLPWAAVVLLVIPSLWTTRLAAGILLVLFSLTAWEYGLFHMLDYAFYLAVIFILFFHKTAWQKWGFPLLYLATGLSLCWVAAEKWVYPAMATDVILNHGVPTFGFSPETFVVLTAFIEFVVGYLLVVGLLNRLLALVLTLIFISTTFLFGLTEIIGHFMIHIILVTFIIEGVSFYRPPVDMHNTSLEKIIFVFLNFLFVLATILLIYYRFA